MLRCKTNCSLNKGIDLKSSLRPGILLKGLIKDL